ncbi:hypothetical protein CFP56_016646 [Quercus suber]|uniref:Uncharacterized protein n=1 Tax=Quercus suber TaxID=58331 RepID=A0AAW0KPA1_QUESU
MVFCILGLTVGLGPKILGFVWTEG